MYRATTPTHTFTLPIETNTCSEILVSYKQNNTGLDKHYEDGTLPSGMTLDGKKVIVVLTQEETKLFKKGIVEIQVRVLTNSGAALASQVFSVKVRDVINEDVLQ